MQIVEVEICFEVIPTIQDVIDRSLFQEASLIEILVWFPALLTSGRWAHVYFRHAEVSYHVTKLQSAEIRYKKTNNGVYKIRVDMRNLAQATLFVEASNTKPWYKFATNNCNSAVSILLYGHPRAYGLFGTSWGWFTRRILQDVQKLQAAQR